MGPGLAADYNDQRKWSIPIQMKKQKMIDQLVTSFLTCGDEPMIRYGSIEYDDANISNGTYFRKIKTIDNDSWDVYL